MDISSPHESSPEGNKKKSPKLIAMILIAFFCFIILAVAIIFLPKSEDRPTIAEVEQESALPSNPKVDDPSVPEEIMDVKEVDAAIYKQVIMNNCLAWKEGNISRCADPVNTYGSMIFMTHFNERANECAKGFIEVSNLKNNNADSCALLDTQEDKEHCEWKFMEITTYIGMELEAQEEMCKKNALGDGYWECLALLTGDTSYCENIGKSGDQAITEPELANYKKERCRIFYSSPDTLECI